MRKSTINLPVFLTSAICLVVFLGIGVAFPDWNAKNLPKALGFVTKHFSWLFVVSVTFFIGFCFWLLFSRYRHLRLGPADSRPDFSTASWFAMLFSAGMGIGLVFFGVYEPMYHFENPPTGEGGTGVAAAFALPMTFFHWGLNAWAIYAVLGLAIAYFHYRRGLPLALRSCFYPLLGERIHGLFGHFVDIIAVFGTLFGLAVSLGLGAMQVAAGFGYLFDVPTGIETQLILIGSLTVVATISLLTGVSKGIKRLSELNLVLASCLLLFVFLMGPTLFALDSMVQGTGDYVSTIFQRSLHTASFDTQGTDKALTQGWTVFYWAWWISWAPFVGMFIARISRGRTIRQFILGVLLVPTAVTIVWFSIFGATAIELQQTGTVDMTAAVGDKATAIYVMLDALPFGFIASLLTTFVVIVFFVTSSDSASFVVDMLTSGGHPNPPKWQRVFWASAEGAVAGVLLYSAKEDGLRGLQAGVVCLGLPFCILMLLICFSLVRSLRTHEREPIVNDES